MARSIIRKEKKKPVKLDISDKLISQTSKLRCEDCKKILNVDKFYKNSSNKNGYYGICIECMRKRALDSESGELTKFGLTSLLQIINLRY